MEAMDQNERDPVVLWAEIHRLRAQAKGPDGFDTWMDAAISERLRRVDAEKALQNLKDELQAGTPYLPYLCDRADGVKGHYAIARMHPKGYREVWNLRGHGWAAFSDDVLTWDEAIEALRKIGATVQPLHAVGKGCPDLLVGWRGMTSLLEVKDGKKPPSARKLTEDQEKWHANWRGQVAVVETVEQAIEAITN